MTNLLKIGKGFALFLICILATSLFYTMFTVIFESVNDPTDTAAVGDTIEGIFWFIIIIVWILGTLVLPAALYYEGITEKDELNPVVKGSIGVLLFIFGMLLTIKAYYLTTVIQSFMDSTIQIILFWLALIMNWATIVLIAPYYMIADARNN